MWRGASLTSETSILSNLSTARTAASSQCNRFRRRLCTFLHTHVVLIVVSTLVAFDAVCVIGQMIGDILIAKVELHELDVYTDEVATLLEDLFPRLFNRSVHGTITFSTIIDVLNGINDDIMEEYRNKIFSSNHILGRAKRDVVFFSKFEDNDEGHDILHYISHFFHLVSIILLSLLLLETLLKVFAMGQKVILHKLEAFDVFVIVVSWSLDIIFYKGLWAHPGTEAVTILVFLLPWRVIRIVNKGVKNFFGLGRLISDLKKVYSVERVKLYNGFVCVEAYKFTGDNSKKIKVLRDGTLFKIQIEKLRCMCRRFGALSREIKDCEGPRFGRNRIQFLRRFSTPASLQNIKLEEESSSEDEAVWSGSSGSSGACQSGNGQETSSISSESPLPAGENLPATAFQQSLGEEESQCVDSNTSSDISAKDSARSGALLKPCPRLECLDELQIETYNKCPERLEVILVANQLSPFTTENVNDEPGDIKTKDLDTRL